MATQPFDLGAVYRTVEGVKGARLDNQRRQQDIDATNQQAQTQKLLQETAQQAVDPQTGRYSPGKHAAALESAGYGKAAAKLRQNALDYLTKAQQYVGNAVKTVNAQNYGAVIGDLVQQGIIPDGYAPAQYDPTWVQQANEAFNKDLGEKFGELQQLASGPGGAIIYGQRNLRTGEIPRMTTVKPNEGRDGPTARFSPVTMADGSIGSYNNLTGDITPTGQRAPQKAPPSMQLRKEFRGLQSVKDYETSLPLVESAKRAPDTGYGDLQLIYTAGKVLDPGSVVREGELQLTISAGSPLQRVLGATRFNFERGGRITPQARAQIIGMLNERVGAYRQAYDRDYAQYTEYAQESGLDQEQVVGSHPSSAYAQKGPAQVNSNDDYNALPRGAQYVGPDGRTRVKQ